MVYEIFEVLIMEFDYYKNRCRSAANYIIENNTTIRKTAEKLGVSKSTVHKDLIEKLPAIDPYLSLQVRRILDINREERHIRGGQATKEKYMQIGKSNIKSAPITKEKEKEI